MLEKTATERWEHDMRIKAMLVKLVVVTGLFVGLFGAVPALAYAGSNASMLASAGDNTPAIIIIAAVIVVLAIAILIIRWRLMRK